MNILNTQDNTFSKGVSALALSANNGLFSNNLLVGLKAPDASVPNNILQTTSLVVSGLDLTAGGQIPSTVIRGGTFLGKADGTLGMLTNTHNVWGPSVFEFAGVNFNVTQYNNLYFTAGYFPQLWLSTSGNVGIQTAYPNERLTVNGNISASGNADVIGLSARRIDLTHTPANDGTNPVLRLGEYDTTTGNQGFSGLFLSYDEISNVIGLSSVFAPAVGIPAINIDRFSNTSIRSLYAGAPGSAYTGSFTSLSAISGMYVDPVSGYAGFMTFNPIAPMDVRGSMYRVASAGTMTLPSNLRVQGNFAYVLNYTSGSLQVFDISYTSALSTVSAGAGTNPYGLYVSGKYAYVVTYNGSSSQLLIFDLSVTTPIMVSSTTIGWGNFNATDVYVQGNYAYILGSSSTGPTAGRITVWDISNPANPRMIINYSSVGIGPRGLIVQDRYAYYSTSSFGSIVLYRLDVSDVSNGILSAPSSIYSTVGSMYCFTVRGNYLYMDISSTIRIVDLSRGTLLSTLTIPTIPLGWAAEMVLQGNYLYVIRLSVLMKIDISSPIAPFIVQYSNYNTGSTTVLNPLQIQGRYAYILDQLSVTPSIRVIDLGGAYIQQLQTGGVKTDKLYVAQNSILGNDLDVAGGAGFGQGFKSYKDSSIQGALTLTTLSGASAVNYFSVLSGFNSTLFLINTAGNVGINTGYPNQKLTVVGNISATGSMALASTTTSTLTSNGALTVVGGVGIGDNLNVSGIVKLLNSSNTPTLQLSGYANKGGVGYHDFMSVTNTYGSVSTPTKYFRLNSSGDIEVINDAYSQMLLQLTNNGALNVYGVSPAVVSNNDALSGYIGFNNNNSQIYDDGNMHIHARGSGNGIWINTNNAQINMGAQSPVNGGSVASAITMGGSTATGYLTINTSKSYTTSQSYGYLVNQASPTGVYGGGSQTLNVSMYATSRIMAQEVDAFSDERLKDIQGAIPLDSAIKFVKNIDGLHFKWKPGFGDTGLKAGFGAQSVHKAGFEHMISVIKNDKVEGKIDADGWVHPDKEQLNMNYDQAVPYHHQVIKNLLERIEGLEKQICELKIK